MDDHPSSPSKIDLVFEALALVAGMREAERAISRSALREQRGDDRAPEPPKKKQRAT